MANNLHVFFDNARTNQISVGTQANPDAITGSGDTGFVDTKNLFLGNTSAAHYYTGSSLQAVNDDANVDVGYSLTIGGVYTDTLAFAGSQLSLTSLSFFRRATVASGLPATHRTDIKHRLLSTEHAN